MSHPVVSGADTGAPLPFGGEVALTDVAFTRRATPTCGQNADTSSSVAGTYSAPGFVADERTYGRLGLRWIQSVQNILEGNVVVGDPEMSREVE